MSELNIEPRPASGAAEVAIRCRDLALNFGSQAALRGVSIDVDQGELVVVLGPSGCGKTSLLRALAGLERPDSGTIEVDGRPVFGPGLDVEPAERGVGFVFQDLGLWPGMTALNHLLFVLGRGVSDRETRAMDRLRALHIDHLAHKKPGKISGGEAQRLALARALVSDPGLLFLDEPLSSLDPVVAREIRGLLQDIHRQENRTMIYVTHDRDEAFELADRIMLMRGGGVAQVGSAEDLARRPASTFAAEFLGLGSLLPARNTNDDEVETLLGRHRRIGGSSPDAESLAFIGRRDLRLSDDGVRATVIESRYRGDDWAIEVELSGRRLEFCCDHDFAPGVAIGLVGPDQVWCLGAEGVQP